MKNGKRKWTAVLLGISMLLMSISAEEVLAASRASMYVISGVTTDGGKYSEIAYNEAGLLKTFRESGSETRPGRLHRYTYDSKNRLTELFIDASLYRVRTYSYDKKNRVSRMVYREYAGMDSMIAERTIKYTYNAKNQIKSASQSDGAQYTYAYDSSGRIRTIQEKGYSKYTYSYKYDKNGNLKSEVKKDQKGKTVSSISYKNTYKSKRLTKRVIQYKTGTKEKYTRTYTYKKISVNQALKNRIQAQQADLLMGYWFYPGF